MRMWRSAAPQYLKVLAGNHHIAYIKKREYDLREAGHVK
jgi:hypothetical protein